MKRKKAKRCPRCNGTGYAMWGVDALGDPVIDYCKECMGTGRKP